MIDLAEKRRIKQEQLAILEEYRRKELLEK